MHWVAATTFGCGPGEVVIMDSLNGGSIPHHVKNQVCYILHTDKKEVNFTIASVQQQTGGVDCGLFALAFVNYILENCSLPTCVNFDQSQMRTTLRRSLQQKQISPVESKTALCPRQRLGVFNAQPSRHVRSQDDLVCSRGFSVTWDPQVDT